VMNKFKTITSGVIVMAAGIFAGDSQVAVTIYNDNLALVREVRTIQLQKGLQEFRFVNVAAEIDPTSVHFKPLSNAAGVTLLEQNFEYDLVGMDRLLQKYIDQDIIVSIRENGTVKGTLLSAVGDDVVLSIEGGQIRAIKAAALESVIFPSLPNGLITRPTLVWLLNSTAAGPVNSEISYLTTGISWHAEYVAVVNNKDTQLDLAGWVSIDNKSGADYEDAKLKLVAGDVNRVQPRPVYPMLKRDMVAMAAPNEGMFAEKTFFEYHLYTLQRAATIKDRQIKQVSLFEPQTTPVEKIYSYDGAQDDKKVQVRLEFKNSQENNLGMPLPAGKVRVYKRDDDGSQEFIGEDALDHTPKDEMVRLTMGNAFDVVGERNVLRVQQVNEKSRQQTVEIVLRNHKKEAIQVTVIEHQYGDWQLVGKTPTIKKKTADRVEFVVTVPVDGETRFEYTVLTQY
jgi:hypothetical protein